MAENNSKIRRPWLAGLLSLTGIPLGQLYAGRLRRALIIAIAWTLLSPLIFSAVISLPFGRILTCCFFVFALAFPVFLAIDAVCITRFNRFAPLKRYQRWWVYLLAYAGAILLANVIAIVIRDHISEAFIVPGRAMAPTVNHNDRVLVDKFLFDASQIERHDLVVYLEIGQNPQMQLKRVVGLPGETVEIKDETLFINGTQASEDRIAFIDKTAPVMPELSNFGPYTIPNATCFVLGDNRRVSLDSRTIGPIPYANISGVARLIYWSNDYRFEKNYPQSIPVCGPIRWDRIGLRLD